MKTLKTFIKKGYDKIELIEDIKGVFIVKISNGEKVKHIFYYETLYIATDMFWYCVSLETRIDKYIK